MGGYAVNFIVYIMAMTGLICFAVFVYKKIMTGGIGNKHTKFIEIEDTLGINPRKSLHVVRAGGERFLIASDFDRTSLISRLNPTSGQNPQRAVKEAIDELYSTPVQSFNAAMAYAENKSQAKPVIQQPKQHRTKPYIHLEPITQKANRGVGIAGLRKEFNARADEFEIQDTGRTQNRKALAAAGRQGIPYPQERQVRQNKTSGAAALRDMAKKINEL